MAIIQRFVGSILQCNQTVTSNPFSASASNFLGLKQSIRSSPYILKVTQHFTMRTPLILGKNSQLTAHNTLTIGSAAYRVHDASASNRINLYHFSRPCAYENVSQLLSLSQSVDGEMAKGPADTMEFAQTVEVTVVRDQVVTQVLIMHSGIIGYIPDDEFYAIPISLPGGPPGNDGRS